MKQLLARLIQPSGTNGNVLTTVAGKSTWAPPSAGALNDLTDVDTATTAPADGDTLSYHAASGLWLPGAPATGGGGGGGAEGSRYWAQMTSDTTVNPVPTTSTLVPSLTVTVPSATATRTAFITFRVLYTGTHANRYAVFVDGTSVIGGSNWHSYRGGATEGVYQLMVPLQIASLASGSAHTVEVRHNAEDTTTSVTYSAPACALIVDVYASTSSPMNI